MAKTIKLRFKGCKAVHSVTVRIDDSKVPLEADCSGSKGDVSAGEHYLQWLGTGPPGVECTLSIEEPREAKWSCRFRIAGDGLFGGSKKFRINQK